VRHAACFLRLAAQYIGAAHVNALTAKMLTVEEAESEAQRQSFWLPSRAE
jgi:hypothetical protein